jgi:quinolinate synthase
LKDLQTEIRLLKQKRKAIILAHNYQLDEVQEMADYVGDSFYLSKIATGIECEVIVFCGVKFMAETAKILAPGKVVLLPESDAGCPMADMITEEDLRKLKDAYPGAPVVCYVNSSAAVKAESDVCCTSSNAVKVVASLPDRQVIFVPDENLGTYVSEKLPAKEMVLWPGHCVTHAKIKASDVEAVRARHPQAQILVHPECDPSVVALADFAGSTSEIINYADKSAAKAFIIGTEMGVLHKLKALRPDSQFLLLHPGLVCPNMKKTRLRSVYEALLNSQHEITVDECLALRARTALDRMLELA